VLFVTSQKVGFTASLFLEKTLINTTLIVVRSHRFIRLDAEIP